MYTLRIMYKLTYQIHVFVNRTERLIVVLLQNII